MAKLRSRWTTARTAQVIVMVGGLALVTGCGSDGHAAKGTPEVVADAGPTKTTSATKDFKELLAHDWTADPGVEAYFCGYKTLTEDLLISDFRPLMATGTHHVVLGYQEPARPDGFVDGEESSTPLAPDVCSGVTFGDVFAFTATVGTQELNMPEGVAVRIPAGKQLVLGLHVINTGTTPISGHSGVQVVTPEASKVVHEAESIAVQNVSFSVPPGKSTQTATCTMVQDATIFAVLPHMHLTGVHMKTTAERKDGSEIILLDDPFHFNEQNYKPFAPGIQLLQGEQIHVACDYENPGSDTLTVGESTTKNEMCITFAYRYPAVSANATAEETGGLPRGYCIK